MWLGHASQRVMFDKYRCLSERREEMNCGVKSISGVSLALMTQRESLTRV